MKITIERETLERAMKAIELRSWNTTDEEAAIVAMRAALAAQPADPNKPTVQRLMDLARRFRSAPGDQYDGAYKALQDACYEALAQPAEPVEPVAEIFDTFGNSQDADKCVMHAWLKRGYFPPRGTKLYAAPPAPATVPPGSFAIGDKVRKRTGSAWSGAVVGTYSTTLTPEGYAVESDAHPGSVQIYPAAALITAAGEKT